MGCFVRGGKNGMGCFVRGDKNCMGCFVRGGKLMRDVLSGVAKNGMGCFVPGCFVPFASKLTENALILCYNFFLSDCHFFLIFLEGEIMSPCMLHKFNEAFMGAKHFLCFNNSRI